MDIPQMRTLLFLIATSLVFLAVLVGRLRNSCKELVLATLFSV